MDCLKGAQVFDDAMIAEAFALRVPLPVLKPIPTAIYKFTLESTECMHRAPVIQ
jgi:hypothetical protein